MKLLLSETMSYYSIVYLIIITTPECKYCNFTTSDIYIAGPFYTHLKTLL